jgi:hypothetical protein
MRDASTGTNEPGHYPELYGILDKVHGCVTEEGVIPDGWSRDSEYEREAVEPAARLLYGNKRRDHSELIIDKAEDGVVTLTTSAVKRNRQAGTEEVIGRSYIVRPDGAAGIVEFEHHTSLLARTPLGSPETRSGVLDPVYATKLGQGLLGMFGLECPEHPGAA